MTFQIKQPVGLAARLRAANPTSTGAELKAPEVKPITYLSVADPAIKDRLGIVFDDSSSMYGSKIKEARDGVIEFLRNCVPNQTAVAIYPMNDTAYPLDTNLPYLAGKVLDIQAVGSTPLVRTAIQMLGVNTTLTRGIIFSDGSPDSLFTDALVATCRERKVPLDTVYIGEDYEGPIAFMRKLAEDTGGTFIHLKAGVSIRDTFKYLAPVYHALLTDKSFVENLQNGKV